MISSLPTALSKLPKNSKISAAIELAVYSEISVLPYLLQLVKKITPPYSKDKFGKRFDNLYRTHQQPKKSGGNRTICAPSFVLNKVQRSFLNLLYHENLSEAANGFIPKFGIKENAQKHVGQEIVVNADIKEFFPSTSVKKIFYLSKKLSKGRLSNLASIFFTEISCYNGFLATGAPTSPMISNLILQSLDLQLLKISKKLNVNYTRYADDITFSGDSAAVWMLKPLKGILKKHNYELDDKKTNIFRKGRRQSVTGVVVNQKLSLPRPIKRRLRAAVHNRSLGQPAKFHNKPINDQQLLGYLTFYSMIEPKAGKKLIKKFKNVVFES